MPQLTENENIAHDHTDCIGKNGIHAGDTCMNCGSNDREDLHLVSYNKRNVGGPRERVLCHECMRATAGIGTNGDCVCEQPKNHAWHNEHDPDFRHKWQGGWGAEHAAGHGQPPNDIPAVCPHCHKREGNFGGTQALCLNCFRSKVGTPHQVNRKTGVVDEAFGEGPFGKDFHDCNQKGCKRGPTGFTYHKIDDVSYYHHGACKKTIGPKGGEKDYIQVWRNNGAIKTWKTRPGEFRIPVKHGMYDYSEINHNNASEFHTEDECPVYKKNQVKHDRIRSVEKNKTGTGVVDESACSSHKDDPALCPQAHTCKHCGTRLCDHKSTSFSCPEGGRSFYPDAATLAKFPEQYFGDGRRKSGVVDESHYWTKDGKRINKKAGIGPCQKKSKGQWVCNADATHTLKGTPYCDEHGSSKYDSGKKFSGVVDEATTDPRDAARAHQHSECDPKDTDLTKCKMYADKKKLAGIVPAGWANASGGDSPSASGCNGHIHKIKVPPLPHAAAFLGNEPIDANHTLGGKKTVIQQYCDHHLKQGEWFGGSRFGLWRRWAEKNSGGGKSGVVDEAIYSHKCSDCWPDIEDSHECEHCNTRMSTDGLWHVLKHKATAKIKLLCGGCMQDLRIPAKVAQAKAVATGVVDEATAWQHAPYCKHKNITGRCQGVWPEQKNCTNDVTHILKLHGDTLYVCEHHLKAYINTPTSYKNQTASGVVDEDTSPDCRFCGKHCMKQVGNEWRSTCRTQKYPNGWNHAHSAGWCSYQAQCDTCGKSANDAHAVWHEPSGKSLNVCDRCLQSIWNKDVNVPDSRMRNRSTGVVDEADYRSSFTHNPTCQHKALKGINRPCKGIWKGTLGRCDKEATHELTHPSGGAFPVCDDHLEPYIVGGIRYNQKTAVVKNMAKTGVVDEAELSFCHGCSLQPPDTPLYPYEVNLPGGAKHVFTLCKPCLKTAVKHNAKFNNQSLKSGVVDESPVIRYANHSHATCEKWPAKDGKRCEYCAVKPAAHLIMSKSPVSEYPSTWRMCDDCTKDIMSGKLSDSGWKPRIDGDINNAIDLKLRGIDTAKKGGVVDEILDPKDRYGMEHDHAGVCKPIYGDDTHTKRCEDGCGRKARHLIIGSELNAKMAFCDNCLDSYRKRAKDWYNWSEPDGSKRGTGVTDEEVVPMPFKVHSCEDCHDINPNRYCSYCMNEKPTHHHTVQGYQYALCDPCMRSFDTKVSQILNAAHGGEVTQDSPAKVLQFKKKMQENEQGKLPFGRDDLRSRAPKLHPTQSPLAKPKKKFKFVGDDKGAKKNGSIIGNGGMSEAVQFTVHGLLFSADKLAEKKPCYNVCQNPATVSLTQHNSGKKYTFCKPCFDRMLKNSNIDFTTDKGKSGVVDEGKRGDWKAEGYEIRHKLTDTTGPFSKTKSTMAFITAHDKHGKEVGSLDVSSRGDLEGISVHMAEVLHNHRRKGLATAMYDRAREIFPGKPFGTRAQTAAAKKFRRRYDGNKKLFYENIKQDGTMCTFRNLNDGCDKKAVGRWHDPGTAWHGALICQPCIDKFHKQKSDMKDYKVNWFKSKTGVVDETKKVKRPHPGHETCDPDKHPYAKGRTYCMWGDTFEPKWKIKKQAKATGVVDEAKINVGIYKNGAFKDKIINATKHKSGMFAVHPKLISQGEEETVLSKTGVSLTHVQSGVHLGHFDSKEEAMKAADLLAPHKTAFNFDHQTAHNVITKGEHKAHKDMLWDLVQKARKGISVPVDTSARMYTAHDAAKAKTGVVDEIYLGGDDHPMYNCRKPDCDEHAWTHNHAECKDLNNKRGCDDVACDGKSVPEHVIRVCERATGFDDSFQLCHKHAAEMVKLIDDHAAKTGVVDEAEHDLRPALARGFIHDHSKCSPHGYSDYQPYCEFHMGDGGFAYERECKGAPTHEVRRFYKKKDKRSRSFPYGHRLLVCEDHAGVIDSRNKKTGVVDESNDPDGKIKFKKVINNGGTDPLYAHMDPEMNKEIWDTKPASHAEYGKAMADTLAKHGKDTLVHHYDHKINYTAGPEHGYKMKSEMEVQVCPHSQTATVCWHRGDHSEFPKAVVEDLARFHNVTGIKKYYGTGRQATAINRMRKVMATTAGGKMRKTGVVDESTDKKCVITNHNGDFACEYQEDPKKGLCHNRASHEILMSAANYKPQKLYACPQHLKRSLTHLRENGWDISLPDVNKKSGVFDEETSDFYDKITFDSKCSKCGNGFAHLRDGKSHDECSNNCKLKNHLAIQLPKGNIYAGSYCEECAEGVMAAYEKNYQDHVLTNKHRGTGVVDEATTATRRSTNLLHVSRRVHSQMDRQRAVVRNFERLNQKVSRERKMQRIRRQKRQRKWQHLSRGQGSASQHFTKYKHTVSIKQFHEARFGGTKVTFGPKAMERFKSIYTPVEQIQHEKPCTLPFSRNTYPSNKETNYHGGRFQQDIEPAGEYMNHEHFRNSVGDNRINGSIHFKKPYVVPFNSAAGQTHLSAGGYDQYSWKAHLHQKFGKKGKALSKHLISLGYDGIIAMRPAHAAFASNYKPEPAEMVNLAGKKIIHESLAESVVTNTFHKTDCTHDDYLDRSDYARAGKEPRNVSCSGDTRIVKTSAKRKTNGDIITGEGAQGEAIWCPGRKNLHIDEVHAAGFYAGNDTPKRLSPHVTAVMLGMMHEAKKLGAVSISGEAHHPITEKFMKHLGGEIVGESPSGKPRYHVDLMKKKNESLDEIAPRNKVAQMAVRTDKHWEMSGDEIGIVHHGSPEGEVKRPSPHHYGDEGGGWHGTGFYTSTGYSHAKGYATDHPLVDTEEQRGPWFKPHVTSYTVNPDAKLLRVHPMKDAHPQFVQKIKEHYAKPHVQRAVNKEIDKHLDYEGEDETPRDLSDEQTYRVTANHFAKAHGYAGAYHVSPKYGMDIHHDEVIWYKPSALKRIKGTKKIKPPTVTEGKHVTVNVTVKAPAAKKAAKPKPKPKKKEKPPEKAPDFRHQFAGQPAPGEAEPDFEKLDKGDDSIVRTQRFAMSGYHPERKNGKCKHVGIRVFNAHSFGVMNFCPRSGTLRVDGIRTRKSPEVTMFGGSKGGYSKHGKAVTKEMMKISKHAGVKKVTTKAHYGVDKRKQYMHNGKALMRQMGLNKFDPKTHSFSAVIKEKKKKIKAKKKTKQLKESAGWLHPHDECEATIRHPQQECMASQCGQPAKKAVHTVGNVPISGGKTIHVLHLCDTCMGTLENMMKGDFSALHNRGTGVKDESEEPETRFDMSVYHDCDTCQKIHGKREVAYCNGCSKWAKHTTYDPSLSKGRRYQNWCDGCLKVYKEACDDYKLGWNEGNPKRGTGVVDEDRTWKPSVYHLHDQCRESSACTGSHKCPNQGKHVLTVDISPSKPPVIVTACDNCLDKVQKRVADIGVRWLTEVTGYELYSGYRRGECEKCNKKDGLQQNQIDGKWHCAPCMNTAYLNPNWPRLLDLKKDKAVNESASDHPYRNAPWFASGKVLHTHYHGSGMGVKNPTVRKSNKYGEDQGKGFYTTTSDNAARYYAEHPDRRVDNPHTKQFTYDKSPHGVLNIYKAHPETAILKTGFDEATSHPALVAEVKRVQNRKTFKDNRSWQKAVYTFSKKQGFDAVHFREPKGGINKTVWHNPDKLIRVPNKVARRKHWKGVNEEVESRDANKLQPIEGQPHKKWYPGHGDIGPLDSSGCRTTNEPWCDGHSEEEPMHDVPAHDHTVCQSALPVNHDMHCANAFHDDRRANHIDPRNLAIYKHSTDITQKHLVAMPCCNQCFTKHFKSEQEQKKSPWLVNKINNKTGVQNEGKGDQHSWIHDHDCDCSDSLISSDGTNTCDYCDNAAVHRIHRTNNLHIRTVCDDCLNHWDKEGSKGLFSVAHNEPIVHMHNYGQKMTDHKKSGVVDESYDWDDDERRSKPRYKHTVPMHHENETKGEELVRKVATAANVPIHGAPEDCPWSSHPVLADKTESEPIVHEGQKVGHLVRNKATKEALCVHVEPHPSASRTERLTTRLEPCGCVKAKDRKNPHEKIVIRNRAFTAELTRCPNRHFTVVDYVKRRDYRRKASQADLGHVIRHVKHEIETRSNYTYADAVHRSTFKMLTRIGGKPRKRGIALRIYAGKNQLKKIRKKKDGSKGTGVVDEGIENLKKRTFGDKGTWRHKTPCHCDSMLRSIDGTYRHTCQMCKADPATHLVTNGPLQDYVCEDCMATLPSNQHAVKSGVIDEGKVSFGWFHDHGLCKDGECETCGTNGEKVHTLRLYRILDLGKGETDYNKMSVKHEMCNRCLSNGGEKWSGLDGRPVYHNNWDKSKAQDYTNDMDVRGVTGQKKGTGVVDE